MPTKKEEDLRIGDRQLVQCLPSDEREGLYKGSWVTALLSHQVLVIPWAEWTEP